MNTRTARWLAWSMWTLSGALLIGLVILFALVNAALPDPVMPFGLVLVEGILSALTVLAFSTLGALVVAHRPGNRIGWLFAAIGLVWAIDSFAGYYALYALDAAPGRLPGGLIAGWLQDWDWYGLVAMMLFFLPLLFPTGRPLSARWRLVAWLAVGLLAVRVPLVAVRPGPLDNYLQGSGLPEVSNPLGWQAGRDLRELILAIAGGLGPMLLFLAAISLILRLRQARAEERQQLKWFAYFGALATAIWLVQGWLFYSQYIQRPSAPALETAFRLARAAAFLALPIAIGIAIFKHRLYDIDLLIRRTLVYGTLTALLAAVYFGVVIGVQALVGTVNGAASHSPVIIVASTLLIAALFNPLRRRLQATIDRRFYRRKYDAARTLEAFGQTLRSEVDLAELSAQLVVVVEETMQPAHVSLWLRLPERRAELLDEPTRLLRPLVRSSSGVLINQDQPEVSEEGALQ